MQAALPMEFFTIISDIPSLGSQNVAIPLFLFSCLLLGIGVAMQSRIRIRLFHLENEPLSRIECTHPHLPSSATVLLISLCTITLLLAGLQTIDGAFPFNDPYQGLNLASFFLIGGSICILAELRWKFAKEYVSAVLVGTAIAFFLLIVRFNLPVQSPTGTAALIVLLLPPLALVSNVFVQRRPETLAILAMTCFFWVFLVMRG